MFKNGSIKGKGWDEEWKKRKERKRTTFTKTLKKSSEKRDDERICLSLQLVSPGVPCANQYLQLLQTTLDRCTLRVQLHQGFTLSSLIVESLCLIITAVYTLSTKLAWSSFSWKKVCVCVEGWMTSIESAWLRVRGRWENTLSLP